MFPTPAGATDRIAELLLHGVVATLMVEGLVHWVPIAGPGTRFALRFSALAAPLLFAVAYATWLPFRAEPWFQDWSLFVSDRWDLLRVGGLGIRGLVVWIAAAAGGLLLARDGLHALRDARRLRRERADLPRQAVPDAVIELTRAIACDAGVATPDVEVLTSPGHTLHLRGPWRPRILVSTATLAALTPEQLRAALAHEIAHLAHRDLAKGWLLLLLRVLQAFNPVAQAVGRRAVQELEWSADDRAARLTGTPLALAQALVRCARQRGDRFLGLAGQGRLRALEERCRRLLDGAPPASGPAFFSVALLWTVLAALLVVVQ